jgi:hypothetical protein
VEVNDQKYTLFETEKAKFVSGFDYKYMFSKVTGQFSRWGVTKEDNPEFSPIGPEIADIEITTSCNGINGKLCSFCYKSNTPNGNYMTFDVFKGVFEKFPSSLTQIAFGVDSECKTNPDTFKIMKHCRDNGIIPNVTVANISDETARNLADVCGAVAVSRYADKNVCYDSVKKLVDLGMKQVNIHIMVSDATYPQVMETLNDKLTDPRLEKLNAIVLLGLKQKGRGKKFQILDYDKFKGIIDFALSNKIPVGFDSCSAFKFLKAVETNDRYNEFLQLSEPCESFCFSIYVNVEGKVFPCSFTEDEIGCGWDKGIEVAAVSNFLTDLWYNPRVIETRNKIIQARKEKRNCFYYEV